MAGEQPDVVSRDRSRRWERQQRTASAIDRQPGAVLDFSTIHPDTVRGHIHPIAWQRQDLFQQGGHAAIAGEPARFEIAALTRDANGWIGKLRADRHKRATRKLTRREPVKTERQRTDEVMRLPSARKDEHGNVLEPGHLLVFAAGQAPIHGRQILYFRDPVFQQRARIAAPATSDRINAGDS